MSFEVGLAMASFRSVWIDLTFDPGAQPYPDWWDFTSETGCRAHLLSVSTDFGDPPHEGGVCADPWMGKPTVVTTSFTREGALAWLTIRASLPPEEEAHVLPPGTYLACVMRVRRPVPPDACSGCDTIVTVRQTRLRVISPAQEHHPDLEIYLAP